MESDATMMDRKGIGKRGDGRWARNKQTAEYLNISVMTLWRWKRDPKLGFPAAAVVNGIERNDLDLVDEWMASNVAAKRQVELA
jgi:hypothetical protein